MESFSRVTPDATVCAFPGGKRREHKEDRQVAMHTLVLLVDDCTPLRSSIRDYLVTFGIQCVAVGTLAEALHIMDCEILDVVITDLILGRQTALALLRRAVDCGLHTILTSALSENLVRRTIGDLATNVPVLEKPVDLSNLRQLVTKAKVMHAFPRGLPAPV